MRVRSRWWIATGLLAGIVMYAARQTPTARAGGYTIAGIVVQEASGKPIKNAAMTITTNTHPNDTVTVVTRQDGSFSFSGLAPDKYSLQAEYRGRSRIYQQHEQFSTGIAVGPGLDSEHIRFLLPEPVRLAVSVVDEEGEPVRNALVVLFHQGVAEGWEQMAVAAQENTGGSGIARFGNLAPGTYLAAVEAQPWYAQNSVGGNETHTDQQRTLRGELEVAYPITYYAGTTDAAAATPIALSGDAQVQIAMHPVPAVHVKIVGISGETPPQIADGSGQVPQISRPPIFTQLSAVGPGGLLLSPVPGQNQMQGGSGDFEIGGAPPGRYVLSVMHSANGAREGRLEVGTSTTIDVSSSSTVDISGLSTTSVSGQISFENIQRPQNLMVWFGNVRNGQPTIGQIHEDGSFQMKGMNSGSIAPGEYEIRLGNVAGLYIKSVSVKGMKYADGLLEVREGGSAQITLVAAAGETAVKGIALKDGKPVSGALVLLVPYDRSAGTFVPRDQSDSDGTFSLQGAHPGRYAAIAIDDGADLAYQEAGVLKPYLHAAETVNVPLAKDVMLRLEVQKRVR